jgi:hypothetical protein
MVMWLDLMSIIMKKSDVLRKTRNFLTSYATITFKSDKAASLLRKHDSVGQT